MLEKLARFVIRFRVATLALAGLVLAGALVILIKGGDLTTGTVMGIESYRARELVQRVPGHPGDTTFVVLFHSDALAVDSTEFKAAIKDAVAELRHDPHVRPGGVIIPEEAPAFLAPSMVSAKEHVAFALVTMSGDLKRAVQAYPALRKQIHSDKLEVTVTGQIPFVSDLDRTLEHDLITAEALSLPLALIVLLMVFGTAVAATLPALVGGLAVATGIAAVLLMSRRADIAQYTINVCSLIGLGVAIDYSLFIVSRYREELASGLDYTEALVRSVMTAGRVVLFSGMAVALGLTGLLFFDGSYLKAIGGAGALVVLLAVIFALTFLPALLSVLGPKIHAGKMPVPNWKFTHGLWHRMAEWVMRRPVQILVPTLALLLLMGLPFWHVRLATADVRILDESVEARRGFILLAKAFPDQAAPRVTIAVEFPTNPVLSDARVGALFDFSRRIAKIPHVAKVQSIVDDPTGQLTTREGFQDIMAHTPPELQALVGQAKAQLVGDKVVLVEALLDVPPDTDTARETVNAIRAQRSVGDGTIVVGGQTAQDIDTTEYIENRSPRAIKFVVASTLIILFLLLGSVILPVKAVIMNVVSITGSFGAIVWVFQDGHLWIHNGLPLEPSLPVILFCALFGMSMDYEVLMLSRIKESYERTGDNTRAVAEGLERTAGLITSAAGIMVVVFVAFSMARVRAVQAVGFGMALAVAMDATLVRVLIVPAAMRLFGHLNWWAPQPMMEMRRLLGVIVRRGKPKGPR